MPIPGIEQPEIIEIDDALRLRRFDGVFDFALEWYRDEETVWLVDGDHKLYDAALLRRYQRAVFKRVCTVGYI